MKTLATTGRILLLLAFMGATQHMFAQGMTENKDGKKEYRIKLVRDENGKKEKIDRTFGSKEEMDAYIKDNHIDMGDEKELTIDKEVRDIKSCDKDKKANKACEKKVKKVTIIEKETGSADGSTELQITASDLTPEERAILIQQLMNIKGSKLEVKQVKANDVSTEKSIPLNQL